MEIVTPHKKLGELLVGLGFFNKRTIRFCIRRTKKNREETRRNIVGT